MSRLMPLSTSFMLRFEPRLLTVSIDFIVDMILCLNIIGRRFARARVAEGVYRYECADAPVRAGHLDLCVEERCGRASSAVRVGNRIGSRRRILVFHLNQFNTHVLSFVSLGKNQSINKLQQVFSYSQVSSLALSLHRLLSLFLFVPFLFKLFFGYINI